MGPGTHNVTADREPVGAAIKVSPQVPRRKLSIAENRVRLGLLLGGELRVHLAAVDQKGSLRGRCIFLTNTR